MATPTCLTLDALRRSRFVTETVEKWLPRVNRRRDLFGCIDIIAVDRREPGILAVQATSLAHVTDRLAKAKSKPALAAWLKAGGRFEVWGWARRDGRWEVKIVAVRAGDLEPMVVMAPARRSKRPWQP